MNILIAGASGFIGQALVRSLQSNHRITVLGREEAKLRCLFGAGVTIATWSALDSLKATHYQAIINLCGHNIAAARWSERFKAKVIASRINTTTTLLNWAISQSAKPHFYSASAIGIYGTQETDDPTDFDEHSPIDFKVPRDFLSEVGIRWEQALSPAETAGIPVTITRFGVALEKRQGMLKKLVPAFYLGLGSVIGTGSQIISWVHIEDIARAYQFLLNNPQLTGSFNLTAPHPECQAFFAQTLAKAMHRPLLFKTPAFIIRAIFGEMGECLLLKGQRVLPKRLLEEGFSFNYASLESALEHEFNRT